MSTTVYVASRDTARRLDLITAVEASADATLRGSSDSGHTALHDLLAAEVDVALLDRDLPGIDGEAIGRALRDAGRPTRVVLVGRDDGQVAGVAAVLAPEEVVRHLDALLAPRETPVAPGGASRPVAARDLRHDGGLASDEREHRIAVHRVAALRAVCGVAVGIFAVADMGALQPGFWWAYAGLLVWLVVGLLVLRRPGARRRVAAVTVLDAAAMFALIETSGDATSALRFLLLMGPLCYTPFVPPATLARLVPVGAAAYVGAIVLDDLHAVARTAIVEWLFVYAMVSVYAVMSARLNARRLGDVRRLSAARQQLLGQLLTAEFRERRRLSQDLHDESLQLLLAARQDLEEAAPGTPHPSLAQAQHALTEGIRLLRETVHDLHPIALDHGGLDLALHGICERQGRLGGFAARVTVAPDVPGLDDEFVVSLARELVTNVAKHAAAERVTVDALLEDGLLLLAVADDGRGIPAGRPAAALAEGHIGLASLVERVEAAGGTTTIDSTVGRGTTVRVAVPVRRSDSTGP
ncbi:response regulator [Conexibacter sp. W3-3-2]|uniref:ATP-binding protein n=1 Tax=Conexibacter sp. W3-3-2 TaxID=2675227 RepID=UPI0012B794A9|nr:ATP-binding protein [Conexibacter sp. W3-3-2]MTD45382.1 response regulator [Conexibacter sp. W3-3-2]